MASNNNKFVIQLLVFSGILGILAYGLTFVLPGNYFSPALPFLFPFFFSMTAIVFNYLVKSTEKKFNRFANRFMLTTFIKLFVYMAVLLVYVFTHKEDAVPFILAFFILYVAYTVFDVVILLKYTRPENNGSPLP
jgi:hypothetical protein